MSEADTYGVVYNNRHGGFGLSLQAVMFLASQGHPMALLELEEYRRDGWNYSSFLQEVDRDDPTVVACILALGSEVASGPTSSLVVEQVPRGSNWDITEYEGLETLRVTSRSVKSSR
jgi:hypothetical protein